MEKSSKKETQNVLIVAVIVVVVTIGFIGGFVLAGDLKERIYRANGKENTSSSGDIFIAGGSGNKTFGFDEKYVESDEDLDYTINFGTYAGSTDAYFTIEYGNSKKDLKITRYSYDNDSTQEYTMSFLGNVVDVYLGRFNDEPEQNTIFYLLDNGDVCYSIIEEMVRNNAYGSYYSVEGISKVVKFYGGNSCNPDNGVCKSTTYAQTTNGKIYDLNDYIN